MEVCRNKVAKVVGVQCYWQEYRRGLGPAVDEVRLMMMAMNVMMPEKVILKNSF